MFTPFTIYAGTFYISAWKAAFDFHMMDLPLAESAGELSTNCSNDPSRHPIVVTSEGTRCLTIKADDIFLVITQDWSRVVIVPYRNGLLKKLGNDPIRWDRNLSGFAIDSYEWIDLKNSYPQEYIDNPDGFVTNLIQSEVTNSHKQIDVWPFLPLEQINHYSRSKAASEKEVLADLPQENPSDEHDFE